MKWNRPAIGAFLAAVLFAGPAWGLPSELAKMPERIERLYNSGLYEQAVEALQTAVQSAPQDSSLHYWLGRCFYELRDYSHAMASLERAIALDPNRSEYHDWLGKASGRRAEESNRFIAFEGLSLASKTHHEFETAVRLDATNLEAQRDLIRYLLNAPGIVGGDADSAEAQIKALSGVDPIEGQLAQAESFVTHKKFEEASEEYQKLLDSRPPRIGVYLEIAEYDRDHGDAEGMEQAIDAGVKVAPSDRRLAYYRGVALVLGKKDPTAADKYLHTYLDTVPDNTEVPARSSAHYWLGRLYELEGKRDQAAEEYQAAITLDPREREAHDALRKLQKR